MEASSILTVHTEDKHVVGQYVWSVELELTWHTKLTNISWLASYLRVQLFLSNTNQVQKRSNRTWSKSDTYSVLYVDTEPMPAQF